MTKKDCLVQFRLSALEFPWPETIKPPRSNPPFLQCHQWQKPLQKSKPHNAEGSRLFGSLVTCHWCFQSRMTAARYMWLLGWWRALRTVNTAIALPTEVVDTPGNPVPSHLLTRSWGGFGNCCQRRLGLHFKKHITTRYFVSQQVPWNQVGLSQH